MKRMLCSRQIIYAEMVKLFGYETANDMVNILAHAAKITADYGDGASNAIRLVRATDYVA